MIVYHGREGGEGGREGREGGEGGRKGGEGGREGGEGKSGYSEWCLASLFNELIPALYSLIIDDTSSLLT